MSRRNGTAPERAVVIGAGFGGLAAAVRLRAMGYEVEVLEALDSAGGRARVVERDGYVFDLGPSVITAPHLFEELFDLVGVRAGDRLRLDPVDPFYRIHFSDGSRFDYVGEEERLLAEIERLSPTDVEGYRALARRARRIFEKGYEELADRPFDRVTDMLRVVPDMARLGCFRSMYGTVSRHVRDPRLRQALTFESLLVGGDPFRTTSIYLLIHWLERKWGVHFARGGTGAIVDALVRLLAEIGVRIRYRTPVGRIAVESGRVRAVVTESGERVPASIVVSNADPTVTYRHLLRSADRGVVRSAGLRLRRQSMSLFVVYFGTRGTYPELAHHTLLFGDDYRGQIRDVFRRGRLSPSFSLYLHSPTRSDPSLAPPGHDAFYALVAVPNTRSGIDWGRAGPGLCRRVLARLEERLLPGLGDRLDTCFYLTPEYFRTELRSADGSAFGPEPTLLQSAYFRYHNRSPDVGGLYFVGAGTHPGAGVPGVLNSAKLLERIVPRPASPLPLPRPVAVEEPGAARLAVARGPIGSVRGASGVPTP